MDLDIAKVLKMIITQQTNLQSDINNESNALIEEEFATKLTPQQRDGIRFLYTQFKKNNPGVILNDPSGYGKRVQTILFLKTIQRDMHPNFPCVIICYDDDMHKWRTCFKLWYHDITADLIYGTGNPFAVKKIFVLSPADVIKYCRKKFTIVVVDNCSDEDLNRFININLLADFKIWINSKDLKKNLGFTPIYEWMHPDQKFDPWQFIETSTRIEHIMEKKLMFERFLENFFLQRDDPEQIISSNVKEDANKEVLNQPSIPVSRKNKDPTGTKVKSSKKRKLAVAETSNQQVSTVNNLDAGNAGLQMIIKTYGNIEEPNPEMPPMYSDEAGCSYIGNTSVLSKDDNTITSSSDIVDDEDILTRKIVLEQILSDYFS